MSNLTKTLSTVEFVNPTTGDIGHLVENKSLISGHIYFDAFVRYPAHFCHDVGHVSAHTRSMSLNSTREQAERALRSEGFSQCL